MEASLLGVFMISICVAGVLLEHPESPMHQAVENAAVRRALGGTAMGIVAISIFCSAWGKRSGAHLNPAVTLSFFVLGKIERWDAIFYVIFQFIGATVGMLTADALIGLPLRHSAVNYAVTTPGPVGIAAAFSAELLISFVMMSTVLIASNSRRLHQWTPLFAGILVATCIMIEAPISGMSMNPARTFASAFSARDWTALWIYFIAPLIGMLAASQVYSIRNGVDQVFCAKLNHANNQRCIFRCNYTTLKAGQ